MITVFKKTPRGSFSSEEGVETVMKTTAWIDLFNPTAEEEKFVEQQLGIEILTREEIWKNQVLNRFYFEDDIAYMTAAIISKVESPHPHTSAVTFILAPTFLVTLRYISPTSFNSFTQRMMRSPKKFNSGSDILEGLLEEVITRVAYNSEIVVNDLDKLSHSIFARDSMADSSQNYSQTMQDNLRALGCCADLNSKINESLHSISRLLAFFRHVKGNSRAVNEGIQTLMTDVNALTTQTNFLSDKLTFQLDATLGMINVEQNMIIKIFSIVTVFFMPATLVSSVYGMNFRNIPELDWHYGYPAALGLMVMCAAIPYLFFRRKGWL